jgi:SAM-dependent methyltransferase
MSDIWRIWDRDDSVEQRTYERVVGKLPEMECAKQLASLVKDVYQEPMTVLDVGCAGGHYYNSLKKIDDNILYTGFDATKAYIEFAKNHFDSSKVSFDRQDIFNIDDKYYNSFDIVYCCNVLLHLPNIIKPIENLLNLSKKYCFIRTLVSGHTHLSKYLYSDSFDVNGEPDNFVHENTYSIDYIENLINSHGSYKIEYIEDEYDVKAINKEFLDYDSVQDAVTKSIDGMQIAGSKVFEWKWIKVTK